MTTTDFETVVRLAQQLSPDQQRALIQRLESEAAASAILPPWPLFHLNLPNDLTEAERTQLFPIRREDLYDDDGR